MAVALRPAHETKHLPLLVYPFRHHVFHLAQRDDGATNGTGLWLGAQCLSLYLSDALKSRPSSSSAASGSPPPRAIELGSGIGLSALALASMGWDVIATDLDDVIHTVLAPNISRNRAHLPPTAGVIDIRVLDWSVPPDRWVWDNPDRIACQNLENSRLLEPQQLPLAPPFDLVLSSDTLYSSELVTPLLRTLHGVCTYSLNASPEARRPQVFLCIERRDPALIDRAISEARDIWNFKSERISHRRVTKAMEKGGAQWDRSQWDGIEIWKLVLRS